MASAIRSPVMMNGDAAGSTTFQISAPWPRPKVRAVRISTGSTLRTPSIVFTRIGKGRGNRPQELDDDLKRLVHHAPVAHQHSQRDGDQGGQPVAEPGAPEAHPDMTQDLARGDDLEERGEDLGGGGEEELVDPAVPPRGLPQQQQEHEEAEPAPARSP